MPEESAPYMSLSALVKKLTEGINRLESGSLSVAEVTEQTDCARQVYERLVVLQYKAFVQTSPPSGEASEPTPAQVPPIRMGAPDIHPGQISLIDSIEELEGASPQDEPAATVQPPVKDTVPVSAPNAKSAQTTAQSASINERLSNTEEAPTLARKLGRKPIGSLREAIGLNLRFTFIRELFEGDAKAYDEAIEHLNRCTTYLDANNYMRNTLKPRYGWSDEDEHVVALQDLASRKFL